MINDYIGSFAEPNSVVTNGYQGTELPYSLPVEEDAPESLFGQDSYFSPFDSVSMFSPSENSPGLSGMGSLSSNFGMFQMFEMMNLLTRFMSSESAGGVASLNGEGSQGFYVTVNNNPYALVPTGQSAS